MLRFLLIDDHALIRKGVIQVLNTGFPDAVFHEASNSVEAMAVVWNQALNLVILDLGLPGRGGLELLKEIKDACPRLPVLVLSLQPEEQFATRVLRAGASGYLSKGELSETLIHAVRRILGGARFITEKAAEMLASEVALDDSRPAHKKLSDREYDVMIRIARGASITEISESLNLTAKTVSTYRARIMDKMGIKNNAEITHYAMRTGLIE